MSLTPLEIIALIFIIITLIKFLVLLVKKQDWLPVIRSVYKFPVVSSIIIAILTIIVFYYIITSLSIIQIIAVAAFMSLLLSLTMLQFKKEILKFVNEAYKHKISAATWLYIIIWTALMIWALYQMFSK